MNRNSRNDDRKQATRDQAAQDKPREDSAQEREKSINGGHQGSTGQRDKHDR